LDSLKNRNPEWLEISIRIDPVTHEGLNSFLFDLGCEGVVSESFLDQTIKAYLPPGSNTEKIRGKIGIFLDSLKEIFPDILSYEFSIHPVEEKDWNLAWRAFFKPEIITDNLMIVPAWESPLNGWDGRVILMDPGPAFGTGQHPTTRMCLSAMERVPLPSAWNMMDVGTGSGILSIYGIMLGAAKITAIDIDLEAVRWARRNMELNRLSARIKLTTAPLEDFTEKFTLVMANLILGTIIELKHHLYRIITPGGYLIISGILKEQVKDVEKSLNEYKIDIKEVLFMEEWACMIITKPA